MEQLPHKKLSVSTPNPRAHAKPGLTSGPVQTSRQLVDPFVAVKPQHAETGDEQAGLRPAAKMSPIVPAARPAPNIDGIIRQTSQPSRPAAKAYQPPAGPLHMQYLPKPRPAVVSEPVMTVIPPPRPKSQPRIPAKPQLDVTPRAVRPTAPRPVEPSVEQPVQETIPEAVPAEKQKFSWEGRKAEWKLPIGRLLMGAVIAGLALFSLELGQLALAVYAIIAIWKRWPSQQTFILALAMFGGIIVTSLFERSRYVAENLAVYAFLLLCIGTVSLALEVRRDMTAKKA